MDACSTQNYDSHSCGMTKVCRYQQLRPKRSRLSISFEFPLGGYWAPLQLPCTIISGDRIVFAYDIDCIRLIWPECCNTRHPAKFLLFLIPFENMDRHDIWRASSN